MMSDFSSSIGFPKGYGALRKPIFNNSNMSVDTTRAIYKELVLAVLLCGSETWVLKSQHTTRLSFTIVV